MKWLLLLITAGAAGCGDGSYQIWVEYDRAGISVTAWDAADESCGVWYPLLLEGFSADGDQRPGTCRDAVDEIVVRLPDGSDEQWFTPHGELYFRDWSSLAPGAIAEIEIRGRFGTRELTIGVPEARPAVLATVVVAPQVAVSWSAAPADLACIHGAVTTHGSWRCAPDLGQASLAAPAYQPDVYTLGVIRLWSETSEPGLEIWQRQELTLEYLQ